jgi:hypothetical protein
MIVVTFAGRAVKSYKEFMKKTAIKDSVSLSGGSSYSGSYLGEYVIGIYGSTKCMNGEGNCIKSTKLIGIIY